MAKDKQNNLEHKQELNDYEVVSSCIKGNINDFAILVDRYKNLVYSVISRMTNNADDYGDIAQEVFIKVYKNLDKYRPDYHFSTWIIRITTNHIIDMRRKKRIESTSIDEVDFSVTNNRSAEDEYIAGESVRELNHLIGELPEMYRIPIVLYHRHGMSYQDIAQSLGLSLSKVKNRIFRGRKLLKEKVTKLKEPD